MADKHYGESLVGKEQSVVIEYVSPNTNKPLHLGHVRNGVLGASVAALLETVGYDVTKTMLVNDRGIHICKSMVAYQRQNTDPKTAATPNNTGKKGDHLVGEYYVSFETISQADESIKEEAQTCLRTWESGDKATHKLWKQMNSWVLKGHAETFKTLGISFDATYFESEIYTEGRDIIIRGLKKGLVQQDETGAVIADLSKYNLPPKVLLRQDGTALYITQDIFLIAQKKKDFKPLRSIYVIGSEQDLYLKQLFAVAEILGVSKASALYHLSYGMVNLTEGRMKSREGTVVDADDLVHSMQEMVRSEITARETNVAAAALAKRSHTIAIAALKFYMLDVTPQTGMTYNPKEAIALQGRTGPYLLYTYARLRNVLRKNKTPLKWTAVKGYSWHQEKHLILQLAAYPTVVAQAAADYNPSHLAKYLYDLAKLATELYHQAPILNAPEAERTARLILIDQVTGVLKRGLALLTIDTLETM